MICLLLLGSFQKTFKQSGGCTKSHHHLCINQLVYKCRFHLGYWRTRANIDGIRLFGRTPYRRRMVLWVADVIRHQQHCKVIRNDEAVEEKGYISGGMEKIFRPVSHLWRLALTMEQKARGPSSSQHLSAFFLPSHSLSLQVKSSKKSRRNIMQSHRLIFFPLSLFLAGCAVLFSFDLIFFRNGWNKRRRMVSVGKLVGVFNSFLFFYFTPLSSLLFN